MEESVDVKTLRARFHAQAEKPTTGGGAASRPFLGGHLGDALANGAVRNKLSPLRPVLPANSPAESRRLGQTPVGVFPKPPPSHREGARDDLKPVFNEPETSRRVKQTGELLQNKMLKHHIERKPQSSPRPPLPSQRSMPEVPPLRKPLPPVGTRPTKPRRPPSVNLDHLRRKVSALQSPVRPESKPSEVPVRPPNKPTTLKHSFSKINQADDLDLPPPPPPPPKPASRGSWTDSFSSHADEESDQSEIYEHIEDPDGIVQPAVPDKKQQKDFKRQQELEKREQKERLKKENEYRKKFSLTGDVEVLHLARVREDYYGGKSDLRVRQGESVEIIRVKNNPGGKWLARNMNGECGYISNTCVDVDYEEVKRKLHNKAAAVSFPPPVRGDEDVYDDVGSDQHSSSLNESGEVYDDVDHIIPDEFPLPPPEISRDPKRSKKLEKEEKEFRKKFKFEGTIKVLCQMMVDPNANIKKGGGKDLSVTRGEILEVIQQTNEKKVLCRNEQGKYGYVLRHYLLQAESEIYDDIDNVTDIYDNDASGAVPLRC